MNETSEITQLLQDWQNGNSEALNQLTPLVMSELKSIAKRHLRRERNNHTLQATALVNELFLKFDKINQFNFENRSHFFAISANCIREILVDYARTQTREKRGGNAEIIPIDDIQIMTPEKSVKLIELDEALQKLEKQDKRKSQVVDMRYFGGLTMEEIANVLGVSKPTIERDWQMAKAWLQNEIKKSSL